MLKLASSLCFYPWFNRRTASSRRHVHTSTPLSPPPPPSPGKPLAVKVKIPGNLFRGVRGEAEGEAEGEFGDGGGVDGVVLGVGGAEDDETMSSLCCWKGFDFVSGTLHTLTHFSALVITSNKVLSVLSTNFTFSHLMGNLGFEEIDLISYLFP